MKALILGMGNPILSDDGVGLFIARQLEGRLEGVDVAICALVGLDLLEIIEGYDRIFLIDALTTRENRPGELKKLTVEDGTLHLFSSHGVNFFEILRLGLELGGRMPEVGCVYGIEIGDKIPFGEEMTPGLREKVQTLADYILNDISASLSSCPA